MKRSIVQNSSSLLPAGWGWPPPRALCGCCTALSASRERAGARRDVPGLAAHGARRGSAGGRPEGAKPDLIVDDEEVVLQTASAMLRNTGYEVALAENGRQAVDLFRQRDGLFALVLLDLTMPAMGGPQTIRQLKAIRAEVPVLVSTGFTEETAMRRFAGAEIAGFIQKPYTMHALVEKIRSVLEPADLAPTNTGRVVS